MVSKIEFKTLRQVYSIETNTNGDEILFRKLLSN
jgi:hypothetical protein